MYKKFVIVGFKFRFTYGELTLHRNKVNGKTIVSVRVCLPEALRVKLAKEKKSGNCRFTFRERDQRCRFTCSIKAINPLCLLGSLATGLVFCDERN